MILKLRLLLSKGDDAGLRRCEGAKPGGVIRTMVELLPDDEHIDQTIRSSRLIRNRDLLAHLECPLADPELDCTFRLRSLALKRSANIAVALRFVERLSIT